MPLYDYRCTDCDSLDGRIGGIDDHMAFCFSCGGIMIRVTADIFQDYFASDSSQRKRAQSQGIYSGERLKSE